MVSAYWDAIKNRHAALLQRASSQASLSPNERRSLQKELSFLDGLVAGYAELNRLTTELTHAQEHITQTDDADMRELFELEVEDLQGRVAAQEVELENRLAPPSEYDDKPVYLEIRAGAGGQEASLFVADLLKMYTNYGLKKGWRVAIESESTTDLGGYREVVLHIKGQNVYGFLKFESGVHRVQRVPATETAGRVHTSTATVAVMPEAEEVDVTINPADLRIDVYRASGAGGQHVNTTDSAVRITHIPTGVVSTCQDERSQHKNKAKALKMLQSRILAAQVEKQQEEMSKMRQEQVGAGMRAEKIRTYNYPQNRVTDHRINLTLKKLDVVMTGALDEITESLIEKDRDIRKKHFIESIQKTV